MTKLTEEELKDLRSAVDSVNGITMELGVCRIKEQELMAQVANHQQRLSDLQQGLKEKYGDCFVNIANGEITYEKEE